MCSDSTANYIEVNQTKILKRPVQWQQNLHNWCLTTSWPTQYVGHVSTSGKNRYTASQYISQMTGILLKTILTNYIGTYVLYFLANMYSCKSYFLALGGARLSRMMSSRLLEILEGWIISIPAVASSDSSHPSWRHQRCLPWKRKAVG